VRAAVLGFPDEASFFGRPLAEVIAKPKPPAADKKPKRSLAATACGAPALAAAATAALAAAVIEALRRTWR